jgi:hypothetical protein
MIHSIITRLYVCDHRKCAFLGFPRSLTSIRIVSELYVSAEEVWKSTTYDCTLKLHDSVPMMSRALASAREPIILATGIVLISCYSSLYA